MTCRGVSRGLCGVALKKNELFTVPTGESLQLSFAVDKSASELYSIMNKTVLTIKSSEMDTALASYMIKEQKVSVMQFLKDNWLIVLAVLAVMFFIILFLLAQKLRAERTASKQKHLLEEAEQVAELQQTVSSLLDNVPGVYFTKDAKTGEYLACNQYFAEYVHKKDPSEVTGLTAADIFEGEKVKRFIDDDKLTLSMDEPLIYYDDMEDIFGNTVKVKVVRQKYTDSNGRLCILGIFQDVSESFRISRDKASSKEAYEKARSNGIIFTHIAQALAQGFMSLFYVDLVTEEFIEYHSDEKDGSLSEVRRGWHFFEEGQDAAEVNVHPDDREEVITAMERRTLEAELDKNNIFMITYRMITDQQPMYVNMKVTRMQDNERFIILSITDFDEQMKHRQAAQRMQEEQTAYSRISALAGEFLCIYIVVPETGRYREYSSEAGFEAFAVPAEGEDFFSDLRENSIKAVYPDDKNRVFTALTMENDEHYIIIGFTDIDAEMREAMAKNEALSDALSSAEAANKSKITFLSGMNHEICTPINAIIGLDTLALKNMSLDAKTRGYLEKIGGSAQDLLSIINNILDVSRIESGRETLKEDKFSLSALLEQINLQFSAQCSEKGVRYECNVQEQSDDLYIGDEKKLKNVLDNILSNAVKFTEEPGVVTLTVDITDESEDWSSLRFCIKDTGIGIDKELLPDIFDGFSAENAGSRSGTGSSGLSLAITKKLVEMMNGSVSVKSKKGAGSEFTVTVTLRKGAKKEAGQLGEIGPQALYILVVDDNPIEAEHAGMVLKEAGIRADICTSGQEALRKMEVQHARKQPYSIVLMDWNMPGMNGRETSAEIRRLYEKESVIAAMTAYSWDDIREEALYVGVEDFLEKPLFAANIIRDLERIARRSNMDIFKSKNRARLRGRRILLAEDVEINAEILMDMLELENIKVDHAENGKIAVELFEKSTAGSIRRSLWMCVCRLWTDLKQPGRSAQWTEWRQSASR